MKVIFLQDVPRVAKAGQSKDVADGYGRNYLIPKKLAVLATPESMKTLEAKLKKQAHIEAQTEAEMRELASQLEGKEFVIEAKTGGKERLYGSVTAADVAAEIERAMGAVIDKRKIDVPEPIHEVGNYEINVKLATDIAAKIKLTVKGQEPEKES